MPFSFSSVFWFFLMFLISHHPSEPQHLDELYIYMYIYMKCIYIYIYIHTHAHTHTHVFHKCISLSKEPCTGVRRPWFKSLPLTTHVMGQSNSPSAWWELEKSGRLSSPWGACTVPRKWGFHSMCSSCNILWSRDVTCHLLHPPS